MNPYLKGAQKVLASLTMAATVLGMGGFAAIPTIASAVAPADYGLKEGDVIRATGDLDIYIVNDWGYKRLFVNPAIFNLYGHLGWNKVKDVAPSTRDAFVTSGLFRNCETGDQKVYGLDVVSEDVANLRWVNTSGAQAVADDANFFKKVFCINTAESKLYGTGADYTSVLQVPNYSRTTTTGAFSATVASDNPASSVLLEQQGLADLAHFAVSGSGVVTKVTLERLGISGDTTLDNVFLFVNGKRVSDSGNFASGVLTFNDANGLFTAPATVAVRANVDDGTSGKTIGVKLTSVNDVAVSAMGNVHSVAAENGELSDVTVGAPTGGGSLDPQADVTIWQSDLGMGANDVYLKRLSLKMVGSAQATDFANFRLFVDGVQVATSTGIDSNEYVTFLLNSKIKSSDAAIVKVVADVVGGASKTYKFQLRGQTSVGAFDLELVDANYNVGVIPTGTFPAETSSGTIGSASLTISKATDSPSGDVVVTSDDVVWGKYKITAYGEAVKIETLSVQASVSDSGVPSLRDGRILINGSQYGSTQVLTDGSNVDFTVNYTVPAGTSVTVEVRADAKDGDGGTDLGNGDVVSVVLKTGSQNAEGVSSGTVLNAPSSDLESNNRNIVTGSMSLAKNLAYANQVVVVPQTALKIGSYTLTGSSTESVNLTNLNVDINAVVGTTDANQLKDMYVKYGTQQTSVRSTVNATQDFSINYTLGVNENLPIEIYANVLDTASVSGDQFNTDLYVNGTTQPSGTAVTAGEITGQTIQVGAGSFAVAFNSGVAPYDVNRIVGDESTVTAAGFKFTATNDSYKITRLGIDMPDASGISLVKIMDGATQVWSGPAATSITAYIPAANQVTVAAGTSKVLTVDLVLATIASPSGGASGAEHTVTLDTADSRKIAGNTGEETAMSGSAVGKKVYAFKAVPVVSAQSLSGTLTAAATNTIAKFNVGSGGTGDISWIKGVWGISLGNSITSLSSIKLYRSGTQVAGTVASTSSSVTFTADDEMPAGDYELKAFVNGTTTGDDYVSVTWNSSAGSIQSVVASASATGSFVWSDQSNLPHVEGSDDFSNDFLVKDLLTGLSWSLQD